MSEKMIWILFDSITQLQSKQLTQEQLQTAIFKMKPSDFTRFHIWTTGWQNWQALNVFLDSDQKYFIKDIHAAKKMAEENTVRQIKKKSPQKEKSEITKSITKSVTIIRINDELTKTSLTENESKFDGENLTWSGATPPTDLNFTKTKFTDYARRTTRHELKIEILLISAKGKTFRSYSKNISLGGTMLEDNIPFDYYGTVFDVVVVSRHADNPMNSRVQLKSKTSGEGLTNRLKFENITVEQKKRLTALLNEYIEKQKSKSKKSA